MIFQMEQRVIEEECARAKVAATRVAMVVANEWKDDNDKVITVKQWLEERKMLMVSAAMAVVPVYERFSCLTVPAVWLLYLCLCSYATALPASSLFAGRDFSNQGQAGAG